MSARIYSPAKTAMQSGKGKSGSWVLEFDRNSARNVEPLMGYTSSSDTLSQVKLHFDTREQAVAYAQRNGLAYRLVEPKSGSRRRVAYADNFNFNRRQPWTH
ncbi:MAG: ETC complex I subunit [Pseudomonadota bacterium]